MSRLHHTPRAVPCVSASGRLQISSFVTGKRAVRRVQRGSAVRLHVTVTPPHRGVARPAVSPPGEPEESALHVTLNLLQKLPPALGNTAVRI